MQITFNPHDPDDLATVARLLDSTASPVAPVTAGPVQETEPAREPEAHSPSEPETTSDHDPTETDIHGMTWDDAIHSNPPNKNADGSWRARRGRKDEYDAAIAAHKSAMTADTPPTMPTEPAEPAAPAETSSMPAAPAPSTPPVPITYEAMGARFLARYNDGSFPVPYEQVYADLGVVKPDDATNQTQIAKLWHYLDGLDDGMHHAGAVRHALGEV